MSYSLPNNPFHDAHFWVDWIELLCVANVDDSVDRASVVKRARSFKKDLGQAAAADDDTPAPPAEESDKWNARVEVWFSHVQMRAGKFDDAYPFELSADLNRLTLRAQLTPIQKLYLVLLMASCLRCFPDAESDLTASFELISLEAMRKLLPEKAEIHLFGANKFKDGKFKENLWQNLVKLAEELMEILLVTEADFADPDRGDNGLDLVGWLKFENDAPGMLAMFGQCACTKEWDSKQFSSSPTRWSSTMTLQTYPLNSVFIPLCIRNRSARWHRKQDMSRDTLVVDRSRLIFLLKTNVAELIDLPAFKAVDDFLKAKEAVV